MAVQTYQQTGRALHNASFIPTHAPVGQTTNGGVIRKETTVFGNQQPGEPRSSNQVLAALPADVWERLAPHARPVLLHQGDTLHKEGEVVKRIYFVEKGLISIVAQAQDGAEVEIGVIGREGVVGALIALSEEPALHRAMVQIAGKAVMLPTQIVREEVERGGALRDLFARCLVVKFAQSSQSVLCNRLHTVEERLSRWLLTVRDRIEADELELTHEFIARMLGVRRSGVTVALGTLQQAGLIEASRGCINILDAQELEHSACECYSIVHKKFQELEASL